MRWGSMILDTPWPDIIARGVLLAIAAIIWVVVLIRLNGLRSLSKMTNFDFVMTIALGSLVAGAAQASDWKAFAQAMVAMAGLFVPLFLRLDARRLLVAGGILMVLHVIGGTLIAYQWLTAEPGTQQALLPDWAFGANPDALRYGQMIGTESFAERFARRIAGFGPALETQVPGIPSALGTMLVGAGLWRSGLLQGSWPRARCLALARKLALIALPPLVLLMLLDMWTGFTGAVVGPVSLFWSLPFDLLLAIAYAALVMALFAGRESALRRVLAATGRLSLTNYLLTSVVFALLFNSWGLGLYGTVSRGGAFALAFVPIVLMLIWSPLWLARFRQGPFEWLWRGIARGRFGPIRR